MKDRIRVLYVDGETPLPEREKADLGQYGQFHLDTCSSAKMALGLLHEKIYNVVVSGYRMPEMNGIELLRQVRAWDPAIPFIIVTRHGSEKAAMEALNNGADYYLRQKGDPDAFYRELGRVIRQSFLNKRFRMISEAEVERWQNYELLFQKERELRDHDETFQAMVEQSGEGIIIADFSGVLQLANDRAWDIVEYPFELRRTGQFSVFDIVAPEMRERAAGDFRQVAEGVDSFPVSYKVITLENKEKWVECIGKKISYKGSPAMLLTFHDITERMKSEGVLKGSEEKFRTIFEKSPYPICINSLPEGRFLAVNPALLRSSGYTEEEILGKTPLELGMISIMDYGRLTVHLVTRDRIEDLPLVLTGKDGQPIQVLFSTIPITIGGRHAILTMTLETTKLKRVEGELLLKNEELRASEENFRKIFENSALGITLAMPDFRFTMVNPAFVSMIGYTEQELKEMSFPDITHPDHISGDIENIRALAAGTFPVYSTEKRYIRKDGSVLWGAINVTAIRNPDGSVRHYLAQIEDITPRKKAEEALRESDEKLALVMNGVPTLISYHDTEMRFVYVNKAHEEWYGRPAKDLVGKSLADLLPEEIFSRILPYHRKVLGGQEVSYESPTWDRAGQARVLSVRLVPHLHGAKVIGYFAALEDITSRKKAEAALGESEERFRMLLQHVPSVAVQGYAMDGTTQYWNEASERLYGYTAEEAIGKNLVDLIIPPEMRDEVRGAIRYMAETGQPIPASELSLMRKDGSRVPLFSSHAIVRKSSGDLELFCIDIDLTGLKQAEAALRENRQILSDAMDLAQLANWEYDIKTGVFTFDDRFYSLFGTTAEREGGNRMPADVYAREFVPPEDRHIVAEELEKARAATDTNYMSQREHRIIRRDGEVRHIVVRIEVVKDAEGRLTKARGVKQDITERKRAEEALKESEEHYRSLAEHVHDGIFIYRGNRFVFVNTLICQMTGYSKDELLSMDFFDLVHPDDRANVRATAERRARGEPVPDLYEIRVVRKDGSVRNAELALSIILMKGGYAVLGAGRDITERKQAEEALQQANRKLTMLNSITRHDILNQLTALLGYIEFSKEDIKDPAILEYVEKEDQAAKAIRSQIEFTRNYQNIGTQEPIWQSLSMVIDAALNQLKPAGVGIDAGVAGLEIFADPLLEKVFYNLMENSLRHGEHVTSMKFSSRETEHGLVITYTDDGVGIPEKDKKKLFMRGFGKHTGLGLFLSKEILSITGITITENGEPGKGARFGIAVPKGAYRISENGGKGD